MSSEIERELAVYAMHRLHDAACGPMKLSPNVRAIERRIAEYDMVTGHAVDDIHDVMEWLREDRMFGQSDRLRTIAGRLARLRRGDVLEPSDAIRTLARSWPDPITKSKPEDLHEQD